MYAKTNDKILAITGPKDCKDYHICRHINANTNKYRKNVNIHAKEKYIAIILKVQNKFSQSYSYCTNIITKAQTFRNTGTRTHTPINPHTPLHPHTHTYTPTFTHNHRHTHRVHTHRQ